MAMTTEERTARTIARRGAKMVWNKAELDKLNAGIADGLIDIGGQIVAAASANARRDPQAAARRGEPMMADTGAFSVWGAGKLVYGSADVAASKNRPRGLKVPADQVVLIVGFGSRLAHLQELGTVKMNAHPFFLPAFNDVVPGAESVIVPAMGKRARGETQSLWARPPRPPRASGPAGVSAGLMDALRAEAAKAKP